MQNIGLLNVNNAFRKTFTIFSSKERKARQIRSDKGSLKLTSRDKYCFEWIGEQYAIRLDQLQILVGRWAKGDTKEEGKITYNTARGLVDRWRRAGLVEVKKFFEGAPTWVWLSRKGHALLGQEYRYWTANLIQLEHIFWVNQVRLHVEKTHPELGWRSERIIRFEEGKEGHKADGEAIGNDVIAIEVELSHKAKPARLIPILMALGMRYKVIWYFAPKSLAGWILRVIKTLPEPLSRKFLVYAITDETIEEIQP